MQQRLRDILDVIDNYLSGTDLKGNVISSADSQELWDILSALRGPDVTEDKPIKLATTAVIRAVAFPETAKLSHSDGGKVCASMVKDDAKLQSQRTRWADHGLGTIHFRGHIISALRALDIFYRED